MKIIFLDIDGVLNVIPKKFDDFGGCFHEDFVENLKDIIEKTNAKIVISSSWRTAGLKVMQNMWAFRNLPGEVIDVTPDLFWATNDLGEKVFKERTRGDEIQKWLGAHDIENYVIIDDDTDMLESQWDNFVICSNGDGEPKDADAIDIGYGLTKRRTELAIKILQK